MRRVFLIAIICFLIATFCACAPAEESKPEAPSQDSADKNDSDLVEPEIELSGDDSLVFCDPALASIVSEITNIDQESLCVGNAVTVTVLDLKNTEVTDISGIEYLSGLKSIDLRGLEIKDYTPLFALENVEVHLVYSLIKEHLTNAELNTLDKLVLYVMYDHGPELLGELVQITNLYGLHYFDFNNNGERKTDFSMLDELTKLEVLEARRCGIDDISDLSGMTGLRHLNLTQNQFSDISPLSGMTSLEFLDISSANVTDLSPLETMSKLSVLDLGSCGITDITSLKYLTSLTELNLHSNDIVDLSPIANMNALTSLDIYGNEVADLTPLTKLTQLKFLNFGYNAVTEISVLASLTELEYIKADNNGIGDISALGGLDKLHSLDIYGNKIADISALANLPNLEELLIHNNFVSDITPLASLSRLRILSASNNKISDISSLSGISSLEELKLYQNMIAEIDSLSALTKLRVLDLGYNEIEDLGGLAGMTKLEELHLYSNKFKDIMPLAGCRDLRVLGFSGDSQTGRSAGGFYDVSILANFIKLETLTLSAMGIDSPYAKKDEAGWEEYAKVLTTLPNLKELNLASNFMENFDEIAQIKTLETIDVSFCIMSDLSVLLELPNLKKVTARLMDTDNSEFAVVITELKTKGVEVET